VITSIVFSKDRPLQLDLCLNSIKTNFINCNQTIVLHNNSESCSETDKTIESEHPDVEFWKQGRSIYKDLLHAVASADNDYVCFFTDDCIFFSKFEMDDFNFWGNDVLSLSLRMGQNVKKRQLNEEWHPDLPTTMFMVENYDLLAWPRTSYLYGSYWSYPLSVDGGVFEKNYMVEMLDELCLLEDKYQWAQTPNGIEEALQRFWTSAKPLTVSPLASVVVNSPNNRVQQGIENRSGDTHDQSILDLLDAYLLGSRVDLDLLDFRNVECPHTEIDLLRGCDGI
tara:strand:+ start:2853 stop:3698 length:846 start_codon:yes stop_codon:yes gene_type:complete